MGVTCPPLTVAAPPTEPFVGGLFAAARFPEIPSEGNGNRWECGIQYESLLCAKPSAWAETCPPDAVVDKVPTLEFPVVEGTPFVVYLGVECTVVGNSLAEFEQRVTTALAACDQRTVERTYWTGDMGNTTFLAQEGCEIVGGGTTESPLSIVSGLAALESALGDNYCGVGVIHAPRGIAPYAAAKQLVDGPANRRVTPLGNRWAFGAGYSVNTGPDGTQAPAGVAWMYATGQVSILRSDIWIQPGVLEAAFNTRNNLATIFAERKYIVTHECVCFAVPVRLDCDC